MNCSESKEKMVLYRELSADQQKELELHIQGCASCQQEWSAITSFNTILQTVSNKKPQPDQPIMLMDKVMQAIPARTGTTGFNWQFLTTSWTRFSLTSLSLVLVVFFVYEANVTPALPSASSALQVTSKTSIINTARLRQHFVERANETDWKEQCYSIALRRTDIDCLKEKISPIF